MSCDVQWNFVTRRFVTGVNIIPAFREDSRLLTLTDQKWNVTSKYYPRKKRKKNIWLDNYSFFLPHLLAMVIGSQDLATELGSWSLYASLFSIFKKATSKVICLSDIHPYSCTTRETNQNVSENLSKNKIFTRRSTMWRFRVKPVL